MKPALDDAAGFLATLPKFEDSLSADATAPRPVGRRVGELVGAYRLLRQIGCGGMGTVWLAQRGDGLIDRPLALKLPHESAMRFGFAERLERERDILGALDHPNIARLFDAGVSRDGQPYIVLEYVDGMRIDEYCALQALGVDRRLELFLQVAAAVAHAHGKLVVHRDLKPDNILVDARGVVRLLDFGIAKLRIDNHPTDGLFTKRVGAALTPQYASPEQLAGQPVWVASDVYSLGVVLCELLTGQRPHPSRRGASLQAIGAVEQTRPPSSLTSDPKLRARLRGDLDTITLKAVKAVPQERYPTVHALIDDIERHRSGRPVLARADTTWYRFSKWVARHRLACAVALVACALTSIGVVGLLRWATVSSRQLRIITNVFSDVFLEMEPARGAALELEQLEAVLKSASRQSEQLLEADDSLRLRIEMRLALTEHFAGRRSQARARLTAVLDVLNHEEQDSSQEYVHAQVLQARFARADGQLQRAQRAAHRAVDVARTLRIAPRELRAEALAELGRVYTAAGNPARALASAAEAYSLQQALREPTHPALSEATMSYARALIGCGLTATAIPYMRRAVVAASARDGEHARIVRAYRLELERASQASVAPLLISPRCL